MVREAKKNSDKERERERNGPYFIISVRSCGRLSKCMAIEK